jgi:hypothetical protein
MVRVLGLFFLAADHRGDGLLGRLGEPGDR